MIDYQKLWAMGERARYTFSQGKPFPHACFDDFLDQPALDLALKAFPPVDSPIWKLSESEHTTNKRVSKFQNQWAKGEPPYWWDEPAMRFFGELTAPPFLRFLTALSGIKWLLPDAYFTEGGFHMLGNGGKLDPHADFSHHYNGLERRLNLLLYLNADWKDEYGGRIGLYENGEAVASYLPILNRCLIFETSDTSFHGHPEPMTLPEGVYRRSVALYYYSMPRPERVNRRIVFTEPHPPVS